MPVSDDAGLQLKERLDLSLEDTQCDVLVDALSISTKSQLSVLVSFGNAQLSLFICLPAISSSLQLLMSSVIESADALGGS